VVPEAPLEKTEHGLLPAGEGWFVLNAREAAWRESDGMGKWPRLEGSRPMFPQLGLGLGWRILHGRPTGFVVNIPIA
jgi:hypothetical protein